MTKIIDFKLKLLTQINFEQFKLFLDSLDEEKKTWSLDLNVIHSKTKKPVTNIKEYYETASRKDNLGVFAEGKYLYYWDRPAYDFKFGLNYQFVGW